MAAQAFNDLDTFGDRGAQVRRAVDQVALIEVIRAHPAHQQFVHERFHRLDVIIDAGEQHALVAERDSGIRQPFECFFHFNRELARMVHVHAHPERMMFGQNRAQLGRDPLR